MSKIGRRPIEIKNIQVDIQDNQIHYKGKKASGTYVLPESLKAELSQQGLKLTSAEVSAENNRVWGLHRALLANTLKGAQDGFEKKLVINGLGFKAAVSGSKLSFSLGYSHKVDMTLPSDITVEIDKTGQIVTVRGTDKDKVGHISDLIRSLRPPEPYKEKGIRLEKEKVLRKVGKKSA